MRTSMPRLIVIVLLWAALALAPGPPVRAVAPVVTGAAGLALVDRDLSQKDDVAPALNLMLAPATTRAWFPEARLGYARTGRSDLAMTEASLNAVWWDPAAGAEGIPFLTAGGGIMRMQASNQPAVNVGMGAMIPLRPRFSMRVEFRHVRFRRPGDGSRAWDANWELVGGVSFSGAAPAR